MNFRPTRQSLTTGDAGKSAASGRRPSPRWACAGARWRWAGAETILYIEDHPANSRLVERLAEGPLLVADRWCRGLEMARQHRPSLVLLDLHLPDMHGVEVLRALRARPESRDTPVIVISADMRGTGSAALEELDVCARLIKPLAAHDLH